MVVELVGSSGDGLAVERQRLRAQVVAGVHLGESGCPTGPVARVVADALPGGHGAVAVAGLHLPLAEGFEGRGVGGVVAGDELGLAEGRGLLAEAGVGLGEALVHVDVGAGAGAGLREGSEGLGATSGAHEVVGEVGDVGGVARGGRRETSPRGDELVEASALREELHELDERVDVTGAQRGGAAVGSNRLLAAALLGVEAAEEHEALPARSPLLRELGHPGVEVVAARVELGEVVEELAAHARPRPREGERAAEGDERIIELAHLHLRAAEVAEHGREHPVVAREGARECLKLRDGVAEEAARDERVGELASHRRAGGRRRDEALVPGAGARHVAHREREVEERAEDVVATVGGEVEGEGALVRGERVGAAVHLAERVGEREEGDGGGGRELGGAAVAGDGLVEAAVLPLDVAEEQVRAEGVGAGRGGALFEVGGERGEVAIALAHETEQRRERDGVLVGAAEEHREEVLDHAAVALGVARRPRRGWRRRGLRDGRGARGLRARRAGGLRARRTNGAGRARRARGRRVPVLRGGRGGDERQGDEGERGEQRAAGHRARRRIAHGGARRGGEPPTFPAPRAPRPGTPAPRPTGRFV